jgi:uncharacterized membrane-anchored protein YjiN (DUF445 family)
MMTLAQTASGIAHAKARDLARMRWIATGLLALMAVIFVAASLAMPGRPWLGAVRAFAEAGMIGAIADWFAVTALFRRPLGLPIPHTGIIPRNKDRIGEALGNFIAENFLTAEVLQAKLHQFELAHWGGEWLADPARTRALGARIAAALPEALLLLPPNAIRDIIAAIAQAAASAVPAAATASKILDAAWSDGRSQAALDWGVEKLAIYLAEHDELVTEQVEAKSARWMPKFVDRFIAGKIGAALQDLLRELREPGHPWRQEIHTAIETFIVRLRDDPELAERAEAIKQSLLRDPRVLDYARTVWNDLEARLTAGGDADAVAERLAQLLASAGQWLRANEAVRADLNAWGRRVAGGLIAPRRHEIGRFIAQIVAGWDSKAVVDKIELQVGSDLQFIRINGTLVGGLVGLALHFAAQLLPVSP